MANVKSKKKISISAFENIMKDTYTSTKTIAWNGVEITIQPTLSFKDFLTFVDTVVKNCFSIDNNAYMPEIKDFAVRCCVLEMYANFALPVNVERKYDLVYCTDAVQTVLSEINPEQYHVLMSAIDAKIENMAQANIEAINKQMSEIYSAFENMQNQMSGVFAGVGAEEMSKLVGALSEGSIDENKLVQAYIDQTNLRAGSEDIEDGETNA
jgi:hypothetical protein